MALAHPAGAWVEAELGAIPGDEDVSTDAAPAQAMTDPAEAAEFVARTGVDALAVAVGNVHGLTSTPVSLDLDRLAAIREAVPVPLVLHGASGLPDQQLSGAIRLRGRQDQHQYRAAPGVPGRRRCRCCPRCSTATTVSPCGGPAGRR